MPLVVAWLIALVLVSGVVAGSVGAQAPAATPTSSPATAPSSGPPAGAPGGSAAVKPGAGPPGAAKPGTTSGDTSGLNADKSKAGEAAPGSEEAAVIRRQNVPKPAGDPAELAAAALGEDGRVAFQFRDQGWPELIDWLAQLADQPLDWQELPGDRVNITTPGRYSVAEVIDLFNRHLLGRGFTLLTLDGGLTVVKCATLNPAIVPRVSPEQLESTPPHSFVRTSLDVGWLSAEKLAEELKPMISANGKLTALTTTNRIEAMDAAITLRQIAQLLAQEQNAASRDSLVPEFKLRHIPAEEAKGLLEQFLGIQEKPQPELTPQQMQQAQQLAQMRAQQGGKPPQPEPERPAISVVANPRQNSILIQAPPDRVVIATEFLKRIDVPGSSLTSLADVQSRVQVFRLASLDPEKLVEIVQEMNVLEPTTRIRVDAANRALIVSGSAADRFIIDQVISRLDGSGRRLEVLQLRRLDAAQVAESIAFLMGTQDDKEDNSRSRFPSYYFGGMAEPEKKKEDTFRVAANTRFGQVLLWATDAELEEVRNLLVKLGELPPPGGSPQTVRIIEAAATTETYEYLQDLEQQWRRLAPNPLLLPARETFKSALPPRAARDEADEAAAQPPDDEDPGPSAVPAPQAVPGADATRSQVPLAQPTPAGAPLVKVPSQPPVRQTSGAASAVTLVLNQTPGAAAPPIQMHWDAAGNLVLRSSDTAALDRLEALMLQVAPPRRPHHVFTTRYASATWVKLNLEDYFEQEEEQQNDSSSFARWYFGFDDSKKAAQPAGLARTEKLRFIADSETGTIVVSNASPEQLRSIDELIRLWDVPEPVNKRRVRYTRLVSLRYGKAGPIAETIKETYRDLLSSNDKAFSPGPGRRGGDSAGPQKNDSPRGREQRALGSELVDTGGGHQGGGADFSFKGKLSLGIDVAGNTLLVRPEGEPLLDLVCDMIDQLDQAARRSDGVQVVNLSTLGDRAALEHAPRAFHAGMQTSGGEKMAVPGRALPVPATPARAASAGAASGPAAVVDDSGG